LFDFINALAEQGSAISPWLPLIIKSAVLVIIGGLALVPIMLAAWLIHWAASDALMRASMELSKWSNMSATIGHDIYERAKHISDAASSAGGLYIPLDKPRELSWPQDVADLSVSLEVLKSKIAEAPDMAANSEAKKQEALVNLAANIEMLSKEKDSIRIPKIPKISEADANAKLRKQRALYALFAFIPLTIVAILINSALLNVFFSELFGRKNIFGIPYSILIASIFSIIEAGVGWTLGMMSTHEKDKNDNSSFLICWAVILCLILIELVLYFLVGTKQFGGFDFEDVFESISDGNLLLVIIQGGWFSLIGPAIVLSLYLFGHKLSIFYFEFHKYSSFDDFRRVMDDSHEQSTQFLENMRDGAKVASEITEKLENEDIKLNRIIEEQPDSVVAYTKSLSKEIKKLDDSIETIGGLEVQPPELEVQKLGDDQTYELSRISLIYLLLFIMSIAIGSLTLPLSSIPFLPDNWLTGLLLSSFICLVCLVAGLAYSSKVSVIRVEGGDVARFSFERKSNLSLAVVGIILAGLVIFYWNVFQGVELGTLRGSIVVVLNITCFVVGTHFLTSFVYWASSVRCFFWLVVGSCYMVIFCATKIMSIFVHIMEELFGILAMPLNTFFGKRDANNESV